MGKKYHCDYCNKTMAARPSAIKTHNNGISHQKLVNDHYQQFKGDTALHLKPSLKITDPETILAEESNKKPCSRFANGQCQFGSICRYSHYSKKELQSLANYVASKNASNSEMPSFIDLFQNLLNEKSNKTEESDGNTMIYDNNGITHVLPWIYNPILESYSENLPPSVKRLKVDDFSNANIVSWG